MAVTLPGRPDPSDVVGCQLFEILDLRGAHTTLGLRATDMKKNITGCRHKISTLGEQCQVHTVGRCARVKIVVRIKPCTTEIYLHIVARMAD